jgi:hypothetical protein
LDETACLLVVGRRTVENGIFEDLSTFFSRLVIFLRSECFNGMHHDFFNLTRLNNSKATLVGMESIFAKEVMNTLQVTLIHLSSTIGRLVSLIVCKDRSNGTGTNDFWLRLNDLCRADLPCEWEILSCCNRCKLCES